MTGKPWKCDHCSKTFADADGARMHHNKKHPNKRLNKEVRKAFYNAKAAKREDDGESFASRAIDAQLDHAMGIHNDDYDWLVRPFR